MAEDIRIEDPRDGDLSAAREALIKECREQSRNSLYTSTSFFVWLRFLKISRAVLWTLAAVACGAAASAVLTEHDSLKVVVAGLALLGVILPGVVKALKLDDAIEAYATKAGEFKNVEGSLRRAANVWSNKSFNEFEAEARSALGQLDAARLGSLTPPNWCFKAAQKKVQSGDYDPDPDPSEEK